MHDALTGLLTGLLTAHHMMATVAQHAIDESWRDLRNDASPQALAAHHRLIDSYTGTAISKREAHAWHAAAHVCPGHDDESGRRWCAYCGDIPPPEDT